MSTGLSKRCTFIGEHGDACPGLCEGGGSLCFWHDPTQPKEGKDVKVRLEAWARQGYSMEGFQLRQAHLEDVHLESPDDEQCLNLRHSDLYRARLHGAHCYGIDLTGASLMKADLKKANFNRANLSDTNLLGTQLKDTKIERVCWGRYVRQEVQARHAARDNKVAVAEGLFLEAEEVYRNLSKACESRGLYNEAGDFFIREMVMRRRLMPLWSRDRFFSKLVDLFCGYGERSVRVIMVALVMIFSCALVYFFTGISGPDGIIEYDGEQGVIANLIIFANCVYFSIVTFTTLGYGDLTPLGWARVLAATEAFVGSFAMALFVVVFVKKMTR